MDRWSTLRLTLYAAVAVLLGLVGNVATGLVDVPKPAKPWVLVAAAILAVTAVVIDVRRNRNPGPAQDPMAHLRTTREALLRAVRAQWDDEIAARQLDDPAPMPVPWRPGPADHPELVGGRHRSSTFLSGAADQVRFLAEDFRNLKRLRLTIMGPSGSGKTTLAVLLLRELMDLRRPEDPIPILLSASGWHPGRLGFKEWIAEELATAYPFLAVSDNGPDNLATDLVRAHAILPIVDGVDEIEGFDLLEAMKQINAAIMNDDGVVLTVAADPSVAAQPLRAGATVRVLAMSTAAAASYLRLCLPPTPSDEWREFLTKLSVGLSADDPLNALGFPLNLWLFRVAYVNGGRSPRSLLGNGTSPATDGITDVLLDELVPAAVTAATPAVRTAHHRFRPAGRLNPTQTDHWLRYLAARLEAAGLSRFSWWSISELVPRSRLTFVRSALSGLLVAAIVMCSRAPYYTTAGWLPDSISAGFVFASAMAVGALPIRAIGSRAATRFLLNGVVGTSLAVMLGTVAAVVAGLTYSAAGPFGFLHAIAYQLITTIPAAFVLSRTYEQRYAELGLRRRCALLVRDLVRGGLCLVAYWYFSASAAWIGAATSFTSATWIGGLAAAGVLAGRTRAPEYANLRLRRLHVLLRTAVAAVGPSVLLALALGVLCWAPISVAYTILTENSDLGIEVGALVALIYAIPAGLVSWIGRSVITWTAVPQDLQQQTAAEGLRGDALVNLVRVSAGVVGVALAWWAAARLDRDMIITAPSGFTYGVGEIEDFAFGTLGIPVVLPLATAAAATVVLAGIVSSASFTYLSAVICLRWGRSGPLRLLAFLEDARKVGLIRKVGVFYEFRHATMRDRLAHGRPSAVQHHAGGA